MIDNKPTRSIILDIEKKIAKILASFVKLEQC